VSERVFLDTNVLVYADDLDAGPKNTIALNLLSEAITKRVGVISTQVLQEFFVTATKKLKVPAEIAKRKVELLASMDVVRVDEKLILQAIDLHRLESFSFWDALVVRSAINAGVTRLLTEDLQHGRVIDGVRIHNPFVSPL
jgi:predicted nucleic acid-binding protein